MLLAEKKREEERRGSTSIRKIEAFPRTSSIRFLLMSHWPELGHMTANYEEVWVGYYFHESVLWPGTKLGFCGEDGAQARMGK